MKLSRRDFIILGVAGLSSTYFVKPLFSQPALTSYTDPIDLDVPRTETDIVEVDLVAQASSVLIDGTSVELLTYGSFPGPTLRVRPGETLKINFTNNLAEPTNLHLHGLHVSPKIDDPLAEIQPGDTRVYEFTVPNTPGTFWYHPHLHGKVAEQLYAGLLGLIIIEDETLNAKFRDVEEHSLILKDFSFENSRIPAFTMMDWMNGREGNLLAVNGLVQPVLRAEKSTLRLRLLNASNARYYRLALENHPLHLIATDGGLIENPVELSELLLAPGERAEVLVRLEREGSFNLQTLPYDRGAMMMDGMQGMGTMDMGGMDHSGMDMGGTSTNQSNNKTTNNEMMGIGASSLETLLTIVAPANPRPLALPSSLANIESLDLSKAVTARQFVFGENMMRAEFFINDRAFDMNRVDVGAKLDTLEIWELVNNTDMDHPFHLHTYPFQIISRNGAPELHRAWKDVVNVKEGEIVKIAVPFKNFTGTTVYHCHIVEHEDRGMMGVLEVVA